jgi:hypothetical protein
MRPGGPGRIEIESPLAETNAPLVTVERRTFTTTLIAMLRRVARTVVAVKLRARTTMALLPTRWRAFAMLWRAEWRTWTARLITAIVATWAAKALRRRHATFKATIRPLPHHRWPTTLLIAA